MRSALLRSARSDAEVSPPARARVGSASVADHIEANGAAWREWYDLEAPEQAPFPGGFSETLNVFEQMLLLRCVRVDRVTVAITRYVIETHGREVRAAAVLLDYEKIYSMSNAMTPVVFVLSPGADPAFDVFRLGESMGFKPGAKLKFMALGQGMGRKAADMLETGSHPRAVGDASELPPLTQLAQDA